MLKINGFFRAQWWNCKEKFRHLSFGELSGSSLLVSGIQIPLQVTRCLIIPYPALRFRERPDIVPHEVAVPQQVESGCLAETGWGRPSWMLN
jgi:hypothetical protein